MNHLLLFELFWIITFIIVFYKFTKKSGVKDAIIFFFPAFLWGYFIEFFGVNFYHIYIYPDYALKLFGVPLTIAIGWATIIYVGYYITTKKLHITNALNVDIDSAFIATIIDLILLEPLAFIYRFWTWTGNNFWFGAPLLNFVGWLFAVSIFVTSYNLIITKTQNKNKQFILMLVTLLIGIIILQAIGFGYVTIFGKF